MRAQSFQCMVRDQRQGIYKLQNKRDIPERGKELKAKKK